MSRKPPAARRSRAACSSARSAATPIRLAAVRCGTWLTTATISSWRSGAIATTSAPSWPTTVATAANVVSAVAGVGVSTHTAPLNIAPSAPSSPSSSLPAIGWPPTKRASSTASTIVPLTPPTSVTTPLGLGQRPLHLVGDGEHGDGDERQRGARIESGGVDDLAGERLVGPPGDDVVAGDVPAGLAQGEGDRPADQPEADDVGTGGLIHVARGYRRPERPGPTAIRRSAPGCEPGSRTAGSSGR